MSQMSFYSSLSHIGYSISAFEEEREEAIEEIFTLLPHVWESGPERNSLQLFLGWQERMKRVVKMKRKKSSVRTLDFC